MWRQELLDRISGLRTALALVGLLSTLALGVALYALLSDSGRDGGGVSSTRVSDLEERVESLDADVERRATKTAVSELRSDVERLQARVSQLSSGGGSADETQQAIEALQADVQQLGRRIDDLSQQQGGGTPAPGETTPP